MIYPFTKAIDFTLPDGVSSGYVCPGVCVSRGVCPLGVCQVGMCAQVSVCPGGLCPQGVVCPGGVYPGMCLGCMSSRGR